MPAILVVDDHPLVQRSVARLLESAGHVVTTVGDGLAALVELRVHRYDAIVCDVMMPSLDGLEFFAQAVAEYPDVAQRVVFVTAWADGPRVGPALQRTGCPVLAKPVELDVLLRTVEERVHCPPHTARETSASGRATLVPFEPDEAVAIRLQVTGGAATLRCPRCQRTLATSMPVAGGGSIAEVWELRCDYCLRTILVRDLTNT